MPELPEVESVCRALEGDLAGRRIRSVRLFTPDVAAHPDAETFCAALQGRTFLKLRRRGKFLIAALDDGARLVVHLRMTGRLLLVCGTDDLETHTRAAFLLDNGRELRFVDMRRFGRLWLLRAGEEDVFTGMANLGPEPDSPGLNAAYLRAACGRSRRAIKTCLLDQSVVAGIGNIYSDEILFEAGVCPDRPACSLTDAEWTRLAQCIPAVMDFFTRQNIVTAEEYRNTAGKEYRNTPWLRVYGHAGEPCPRCGTPLARIVVGGRSSVFCPACQAAPQGDNARADGQET